MLHKCSICINVTLVTEVAKLKVKMEVVFCTGSVKIVKTVIKLYCCKGILFHYRENLDTKYFYSMQPFKNNI